MLYSNAFVFSLLQVNNNGDITFTFPLSKYTPEPFPLENDLQMIAPYWADVDTRGTGSVYYRETQNSSLLQRARNDVRSTFVELSSFTPTSLFVATWFRVGYFSGGTDLVCGCSSCLLLIHSS